MACDSSLNSHEPDGFSNSNNGMLLTQPDSLNENQGAPCLSHDRGHRGGMLDEPYGGGTAPPPPSANRHEVGGWEDSERGSRKDKIDDAQEGRSIFLMA